MKKVFLLICFYSLCGKAQPPRPPLQQAVWELTEVMFHDVVNPPAAARFYAYCLLSGYELLSRLDSSLPAFQITFRDFKRSAYKGDFKNINRELAVLYTILETGKNLIPSGYLLKEKEDSLLRAFPYLSEEEKLASLDLAKFISFEIVAYARSDGYFKLSTLNRYQPIAGDGYWQPTPPEYMAAVEPHWNTIRTFFVDSLPTCSSNEQVQFAKEKTSSFYQLSKDVYNVSKKLTPGEKEIALFWDCNPFAVQYQGHMSIGLKKISPGGHWMGITGIACAKKGLNLETTLLVHTLVALTLHDAFICCWNEKYRTNRVRPETAINRSIDETWQPLLQTPPFPEFPSGHSVISTASAVVLTHFFGDGFAFTDTVENYIGLKARRFSSFRAAAAEAAISRIYGGIHFRDAVEHGAADGLQIGEAIIHRPDLWPLNNIKPF